MPFDSQNFTLPAVETDEVLRCLIAARALLDGADRWCQHKLYNNGGRCVLGAIYGTDANLQDNVTGDVVGAWRILNNLTNNDIVSFNNAPNTTHADVLALFDRAIAARRAEIGG